MKIAILGAGPAGLSLAYHLNDENINVDIYEQNETPGGLATSIQLWGSKVELGPHLLRKGGSVELDALIKSVMNPEDYTVIDRNTRILLDDKKLDYPPNPFAMAKHLKFTRLVKALMSLLVAQLSPQGAIGNAQDYLRKKLGKVIYCLFIKDYSEKLWGVPPKELHQSYAENLLPFAGAHALLKKVLHTFFTRNTATTLWDFPNGFDMLWQATFRHVSKRHNFYLGTKIHKIHHRDGKLESIASDIGLKHYDLIISTIPAFSLFKLLNYPMPPGAPSFRHALLVYFLVEGEINHTEHCLYLYSREYKAVRFTNFGAASSDSRKTILMMEYWLSEEELEKKAYFLHLAPVELKAINGKPLTIEQQHPIVLQKAYRVPNHELIKQHNRQQALLSSYQNLITLGRNNNMNFNYGMEQAVTEGAHLATHLAKLAREQAGYMIPIGAKA